MPQAPARTFTGPQGNVNIVTIKRPQMREFIKTLKAGDKVIVEGLAKAQPDAQVAPQEIAKK